MKVRYVGSPTHGPSCRKKGNGRTAERSFFSIYPFPFLPFSLFSIFLSFFNLFPSPVLAIHLHAFLSCLYPFPLSALIFTARCYASAVLAISLCLSVSVTSRSSTKTAKRRITQTTPHDTPGSLVFCCQRSPRNSTGVTPYEGAECRWGGQNRRLSTNSRLYLENGKR